ncbi:12632_t:CDS:2 [Dentiscutata erythropus]|uniref:12632_t:CDS:1 n=1 Tax=Dentiscutata erythropus TaxID=1348616 RepID=A0A9N8ZE63_9GLOM|nr:12632_t:CDS:2 [Dentiscutata erythropus]
MSVSTSQNEDFVVEVVEPGDKEDKNNSEGEENGPKKYFAISPEGDFLVELVVKNLADLEFELQMYNINNSNNVDDSTLENNSEQKDGLKPESDLGDDQETSYRKLSSIHTTFKFTDRQLNLIKDEYENIFKWSISVSDKSAISSEFRLLAISSEDAYDWICFETSCVNQHYFLIDTMAVKIYSIECGLEIAEIEIDIPDLQFDFVAFFRNDEMLLVVSSSKWFVWDIFGSLRDSVKSENLGFILELPLSFEKKTEHSNSFIVVDKGDELVIYDEMIIDKYLKYLKKGDEQNWKTLSNDYFSELEEYHQILEPWLIQNDNRYSRQWFYLDEKKEKLLLIENHTIQVWHDQGPEKRSLEFIHAPLSDESLADGRSIKEIVFFEYKFIKVIDISYCNGNFKLNFQIEDNNSQDQIKNTFQIKMENRNDIMIVVKYACYSLKYLFSYKKFELFFEDRKLEYRNIVEQTRKIISRFIRMYPNEWRLLDIRYDLMSVLIEAREYKLINDILSSGEPLHIPQSFSWSDGMSTIRTALSDRTMLACFLDYYSKNAVNNIGWMNTVVDIIPELYNKSYNYYAQKLFYNSCFCNKQLDLVSFKFLKISPKSNDLLEVFVPITQLIPQDSEFYDKIVNIRMVPLTDFTTNKKISDVRERNFTNLLKTLIFPNQYSSLKEEDYSPFIKIIIKGERDIIYENPSIGAVMNWMWYCSKFYWPRTLYLFFSYIGLNESSTTYNPFSNIIDAILAVYDWSSISFDIWSFWPLTIISIFGRFIFVMILQNVIISFMGDAFSGALTDGKRGVYRFQIDYIYEFALLEKSLEFNNLDSKFKDKIRAKYICFYDDPKITGSWKELSEQMKSKPYRNVVQVFSKREFESWSNKDCEFIWGKEEKDNEYWFLED